MQHIVVNIQINTYRGDLYYHLTRMPNLRDSIKLNTDIRSSTELDQLVEVFKQWALEVGMECFTQGSAWAWNKDTIKSEDQLKEVKAIIEEFCED